MGALIFGASGNARMIDDNTAGPHQPALDIVSCPFMVAPLRVSSSSAVMSASHTAPVCISTVVAEMDPLICPRTCTCVTLTAPSTWPDVRMSSDAAVMSPSTLPARSISAAPVRFPDMCRSSPIIVFAKMRRSPSGPDVSCLRRHIKCCRWQIFVEG